MIHMLKYVQGKESLGVMLILFRTSLNEVNELPIYKNLD